MSVYCMSGSVFMLVRIPTKFSCVSCISQRRILCIRCVSQGLCFPLTSDGWSPAETSGGNDHDQDMLDTLSLAPVHLAPLFEEIQDSPSLEITDDMENIYAVPVDQQPPDCMASEDDCTVRQYDVPLVPQPPDPTIPVRAPPSEYEPACQSVGTSVGSAARPGSRMEAGAFPCSHHHGVSHGTCGCRPPASGGHCGTWVNDL